MPAKKPRKRLSAKKTVAANTSGRLTAAERKQQTQALERFKKSSPKGTLDRRALSRVQREIKDSIIRGRGKRKG